MQGVAIKVIKGISKAASENEEATESEEVMRHNAKVNQAMANPL